MWRHYVYIHFRKSDGIPFYVGKGTIINRDLYKRACEPHKNTHWERTVNKHGLAINVIISCQTDEEAQEHERRIIKEIGRRDLGTGPLVNKTEGGDGISGLIITDELRKKRSVAASLPRSEAWVSSIRTARKNGGNGGVVKVGDKLSDKWKASLAASKMGAKNPHYGKTTKIARKVVDSVTGTVYPSVSKAAEEFKLNMKTLYNMLSGHRVNRTSLEFQNENS
jgi:hypothetical protein